MTSHKEYLRALFQPGEQVNYCVNPNEPWIIEPVEQALELPPRNFVTVNPLVKHRNDANVTCMRSWVIEMDRHPQTQEIIPIEEQMDELLSKGCPFNTLVHSAGKSLHAVITLTEPMPSIEAYHDVFSNLRYVFWRLDASCRNPSRLTRVAGALRDGKEQELLDIKRPITPAELKVWLGRFAKHIERCKEREAAARAKWKEEQRLTADGEHVELSGWARAFIEGEAKTKSSRHNALLAVCRALVRSGADFDTVHAETFRAAENQGVLAEGNRVGEIERIIDAAFKAEVGR